MQVKGFLMSLNLMPNFIPTTSDPFHSHRNLTLIIKVKTSCREVDWGETKQMAIQVTANALTGKTHHA